jgi:FMN phosphatase YigB (HAD superfamily)
MVDTILFDLDGTLLRFSQDDFINAYFSELRKVFARLGLNADAAIKAVWIGTKAMVLNDGSVPNARKFWDAFSGFLDIKGEQQSVVEAACDSFYSNEFNTVKTVVKPSGVSKRLVHGMAEKGYTVVLATNPLFPPCAVDSRLKWIDLDTRDFRFITHYENSAFCKPNLAYYREVFTKINKTPQQCIMIGNNPAEDMCVGELGTGTFLVTDFIENEARLDITPFRRGSIEELETFLMSLPNLSKKVTEWIEN